MVEQLTARGLILKKGTIVDSTIIAAPTSTKNKERKRDSDAHQTRNGDVRGILAIKRISELIRTACLRIPL